MFKSINWPFYLKYSLISTVLFSIPLIIFLVDGSFYQAWLLYIGHFLFAIGVAAFLVAFNKRRDENASSVTMLYSGHIQTVIATLMATLLSFILLVIFVPGLFGPGMADKVMENAPENTVSDNTKGLLAIVLLHATVGNFAAGSFVSIIFPFTLKADQTKEKVSRKQAEL